MERESCNMRTFTNTRQITIDGAWSVEEGKSALLINTLDRKEQPEGKLRSLLFAWHKASWYGADVEELRMGSHSILKLSPLLAIDYLSSPAPVRLLHIIWTDRLSVMIQLASHIRHILINGWFVPDWVNWTESNRSWMAYFPDEESERKENWEALLQDAFNNGDTGISSWLGEAVEDMLLADEELKAIWTSIGAESGEGVLRRKGTDEQEWLIAIGIERDMLPFRTALQLVEPSGGNVWRLRPVLQSREGGAWFPIGRDAKSTGWVAEETDEQISIPEEWHPLLSSKMDKEVVRWINVLPQLEDELRMGDLKEVLSEQEAWTFLEHGSIALLEAGSPVLLPAWWEAVRSRKLRLKAKMKSSVGSSAQSMFGLDQIVQFDWKLALGDVNLSEGEFLKMAEENRRLFQVGDEWVHLDPQDVEQIKQWLKRVGKRKGLSFRDVLEMHLRGGSDLDIGGDLEAELRAEVELNEHLTAWLEQLQHISQIPLVDPPDTFLGELRPYQQQGVSWLLFLRKFGLGGVLADDMGLGKTIQFMAYLISIKEMENEVSGPSLLICPTSVIGNWEKELKRFAPSLRVMLHYGSKRLKGAELEEAAGEADLFITSYSLAQLDEEELSLVAWNALCLDEAQNIKNVYTKQSSAIRRLSAHHRIALTGTPMENRLTELWSIYDFINPGYLVR